MSKMTVVKETYVLHTLNPKPLESLKEEFQSQSQRNSLLDTKEHLRAHKDRIAYTKSVKAPKQITPSMEWGVGHEVSPTGQELNKTF